MSDILSAASIEALFTQPQGYHFARWGNPVVPVVFGIDDASLGIVKGAIEAVCKVVNLPIADHDPELGANLMIFFLRDWDDLRSVDNLGQLIDGLPAKIDQLEASEASQYLMFRFDANGGIRAAFLFLRMTSELADTPAEALALGQAVRVMLLWSEGAFAQGLLTMGEAGVMLKPEIAAILKAGYDPVMPVASNDKTHALRLAARAQIALVGHE